MYGPVLRNCSPSVQKLSRVAVQKAILNGKRGGPLSASPVKASMAQWIQKIGLGTIGSRAGKPYVYFSKLSYSTFCTDVRSSASITHFG
jgi:hypothetical protein